MVIFMLALSIRLGRFDDELTINVVLSINCNCKMLLLLFSPFIPILLTSFVIGIEKVLYFLVFFLRQLNCSLNYLTSSFIIKW